jgi:hypothetical protein
MKSPAAGYAPSTPPFRTIPRYCLAIVHAPSANPRTRIATCTMAITRAVGLVDPRCGLSVTARGIGRRMVGAAVDLAAGNCPAARL